MKNALKYALALGMALGIVRLFQQLVEKRSPWTLEEQIRNMLEWIDNVYKDFPHIVEPFWVNYACASALAADGVFTENMRNVLYEDMKSMVHALFDEMYTPSR